MFDLIIRGGQIVDGSGAPPFDAEVGIKDGRIAAVGRPAGQAAVVIDATGLVVAPGFFDMHSHSDFTLLVNPQAESKIHQGVTTEVIGNCGVSAAPVKEETLGLLKDKYDIESLQLRWDWYSMEQYLGRLKRQRIALNVVPLIGHGTVRAAVMGIENRPPTQDELAEMKSLIRQAMEQGAFGFSSGLIYTPGSYATSQELIELSKATAEAGGIYTSHIRGEGDTLLQAVEEALTIGQKAAIAVQISHHKAVGKKNWGQVTRTLKMIEQARDSGLDVSADQYPYTASSNSLSAALPGWMHEGGKEEMLRRLEDRQIRDRLRREIEVREGYWEDTKIASCKHHPEYEGLSIQEISQQQGKDPYGTTFDLLVEEEATVNIVRFGMSEEDVRTVMRHPAVMVGSDGSALATYGVLSQGKPHPRNYGTFPRVLGKYVREEGVLPIGEAIRKMTALPAQKLGLKDRGMVQEGRWADLTLFNPHTIRDRATYLDPHRYPEGIAYVLVAGSPVIERGEHTGKLPGSVLHRE